MPSARAYSVSISVVWRLAFHGLEPGALDAPLVLPHAAFDLADVLLRGKILGDGALIDQRVAHGTVVADVLDADLRGPVQILLLDVEVGHLRGELLGRHVDGVQPVGQRAALRHAEPVLHRLRAASEQRLVAVAADDGELAFAVGLREGERYALMPFELERRDGVPGIDVRQQIRQYGRSGEVEIPGWLKAEHLYGILWLTTPKTRAARRFVPISENLWNRLWARIRRLGIKPHELVFTNSRGNPIRNSTERYNWNKALAAAGLPKVNVHSARHWTASMTARANMPDDALAAIVGHTSIDMTNHYVHRDTASLAVLLGRAIPDLHDDMGVIDAKVVEEAA